MKSFQKLEKEQRDREKAHNNLEAFVFETTRQLEEKDYQAVSSEEERSSISAKLKEVADWLEEQGVGTATKVSARLGRLVTCDALCQHKRLEDLG